IKHGFLSRGRASVLASPIFGQARRPRGETPPSPQPSPPGEGAAAAAQRPWLCFFLLSRPSEHRWSPPAVSDNGDGVRDNRGFGPARFDSGSHFSLSRGRGLG